MVGLNRNIFVSKPLMLISVVIMGVLCTFVFGWIIEKAGAALKIDPKVLTSLVLLGTCKNYGLAAGLALLFFNAETAVPATITSMLNILYIIYLGIKGHKENSLPA